MRAAHFSSLQDIAVDFFADPDGRWEYEELVRSAGFDPAVLEASRGQVAIGALSERHAGFPEGAAVVMVSGVDRAVVALVDCTVATSIAA